MSVNDKEKKVFEHRHQVTDELEKSAAKAALHSDMVSTTDCYLNGKGSLIGVLRLLYTRDVGMVLL